MPSDQSLAVDRMKSYIQAHLHQNITLHQLAAASGYSPWHAARLFKEMTGTAPFDYIRSLRLNAAALQLKDGQQRITDIALDFVFDSHEGFTRAFSRQFGLSPQRFSREAPLIKFFIPNHLRDFFLRPMKGATIMSETAAKNTVFVQVIDRPARKLILKRAAHATHYFEFCEEVGCEIWEILSAVKEAIYEPVGMWMPDSLRPEGTSVYTQGVEVPTDYSGALPEGCELIDLPPCKMMVFQGQPYDDALFEEAIDALWTVMNSYDPKLYGYTWADEDAPRIQLAPMGYRGYIEARPVRAL